MPRNKNKTAARKTKVKTPPEWRDFDWAAIEDDNEKRLNEVMEDMFPLGVELTLRFRVLTEDDLDAPLGFIDEGEDAVAEFKCPSQLLPYVVLGRELRGVVQTRVSRGAGGYLHGQCILLTLGQDDFDDDVDIYVPLRLISKVKRDDTDLPEPAVFHEPVSGLTLEVKPFNRHVVWMNDEAVTIEQACGLLTVVSSMRGFYFDGSTADLYFGDDGGPTPKAQAAYEAFADKYAIELGATGLNVGCVSIAWDDVNGVIDGLAKLVGWM